LKKINSEIIFGIFRKGDLKVAKYFPSNKNKFKPKIISFKHAFLSFREFSRIYPKKSEKRKFFLNDDLALKI
jgi:hypothetical protein